MMRLGLRVLAAVLCMGSATVAEAQSVESDARGPEPALPREARDVDRLGWAVPDFAKAQTGGFVGLFALGGGYAAFDDILNATLLYGHTPKFHAGVTVHAFHLALSARPFEVRSAAVRFVPIYAGAGLLFNPDGDLFVGVPEHYPTSDYYPPTALHWTAHLGTELDYAPRVGPFERHGLYFELVALDTYVFGYFENPETLDPVDAIGSAIGYRAAF